MQHAFNDQTSQTALELSLRSWWFVWREGKNAGQNAHNVFRYIWGGSRNF